ncbi:hypothetical protein L2Y94_10620 [Luteibacter aegosomatis]|uniref:DUF2231 domain-containing protein n=1 Tax=Luteibacter aegosomatis TaxID=2911537 RepID=UPI001FFAFFB4|nr:DUF2231 domain-containing protein [Luteibacter aegosomatis]UPG87782.1 hypothetical protein L2Y94_10620 [Luteibacter aegosomatis]
MSYRIEHRRSVVAQAVYGLLNPIPFGFFVAGLVFDILYASTAELLWGKGAAWLITLGLLFAIVPRVVNLVQVWVTSRRSAMAADRIDFALNLLAIVAAVVNAFVHSRDAYGIVPANVWLSACTVLLISLGHVIMAVRQATLGERLHG